MLGKHYGSVFLHWYPKHDWNWTMWDTHARALASSVRRRKPSKKNQRRKSFEEQPPVEREERALSSAFVHAYPSDRRERFAFRYDLVTPVHFQHPIWQTISRVATRVAVYVGFPEHARSYTLESLVHPSTTHSQTPTRITGRRAARFRGLQVGARSAGEGLRLRPSSPALHPSLRSAAPRAVTHTFARGRLSRRLQLERDTSARCSGRRYDASRARDAGRSGVSLSLSRERESSRTNSGLQTTVGPIRTVDRVLRSRRTHALDPYRWAFLSRARLNHAQNPTE